MKDSEFKRKIKFLKQQAHELQKHATKNPVRLRKVLSEALEELQDSLEELKVAEEELYQQNQKLIESSRTVELEKQRYQELFDFAPNGYLVTDPKGVIKEANLAAASMFQLCQDLLVGRALVVCVAAEDREAFGNQLSRLRRLEKMQDWEVKLQPLKGEPFPGAITVATMRNAQGNLIGLRWLIRDITERKKLEEDRLRLSKLESIGILAGGIAHDFNNMLAGIMTTMSLAKTDPNIRIDTHESLTEAEQVCLQAKRLTQHLLTFSRGGTPVKELVSIIELIRDTATFALTGSSVRCDISIDDDLWNVRVDEGQTSQVIGNIVINAAQATPQGGVINIRAKNINYERANLPLRNGMYVKITIKDEGIGIPKEHLTKIFDPYFTTKQKGSGLGLATAYSIIKSHDGFIDVESELGKGSRFHIYIPASAKRVSQRKAEPQKRA
ncbi:MAG: two-component system sensor histidine kinase NtrB, partial [Ignavibacteriales bacterium]